MKIILNKFGLLFSSALLIIFILSACIKGEGSIVEQSLTIESAFSGVKSMGAFDVVVVLGSAQTVIAKGNQNIIDRLLLNVNSEGILEIELEQGNYREFELTVYLSVPVAKYFAITGSGDLTVIQSEGLRLDTLTLDLNGSGDIKSLGNFLVDGLTKMKNKGSGDITFDLESGQMACELTSSGDMNLDLQSGQVDMKLTGSGHFNLSGFAPTQNVTNSGSGIYRAFNVNSANTTAILSGSGNVECRASSQLNVTISGSGDLLYKGSPILNSTITGTGIVIDAN